MSVNPKPSPPSFVVLRQTSGGDWRLLGEVRRRPGLTAHAARTAAVLEATGGAANAGEGYAAVLRSEWLVAQKWSPPETATPGNVATDNATPEDATSKIATSENAAPENAAPANPMPEHPVQEHSAPERPIGKKPMSENPIARAQPDGHLALPRGGHGLAVLVLHAWWGLNDTMKAFCARLAESGFIAFAPDLYHGEIADAVDGAEALAKALDARHEQARADVAEAARFVEERACQADRGARGDGGVAVIGFSLGAYYALELAAAEPERVHSAVLFYGTGGGDWRHARADYLGHFAESDPFEPLSEVAALEDALRRAGRAATFHRYPGTGHWFFEPDRPEAFNPAAASLAWERTLSFLNRAPA